MVEGDGGCDGSYRRLFGMNKLNLLKRQI